MRKCRYCDGAIEDAATTCPHCGRDLFPNRQAAPPAPVVDAVTPPSGRGWSAPPAPHDPTIARVSVIDIDMPFASMVGFMIKWALAAIPAFLILGVLFAILTAVLSVAFGTHR